jgi:CheY-like chemotaxis protein
MRILILDNDRERHRCFARKLINDTVVHVFSSKEAIVQLEQSAPFDAVFLDHDLGDAGELEASGPGTGYEVAKWLAEHPDACPPAVVLHTFNPVGAQNMQALLPRAVKAPGIWLR